jgi:hypothetical protein
MPQKRRFNQRPPRTGRPELRSLAYPPTVEKQRPVTYGKPFILLEDAAKNTFIFEAGAWVPHGESIAQCRTSCQVKQLAQSVNSMTRYEIRRPIER